MIRLLLVIATDAVLYQIKTSTDSGSNDPAIGLAGVCFLSSMLSNEDVFAMPDPSPLSNTSISDELAIPPDLRSTLSPDDDDHICVQQEAITDFMLKYRWTTRS
jgi:hypothetical protein